MGPERLICEPTHQQVYKIEHSIESRYQHGHRQIQQLEVPPEADAFGVAVVVSKRLDIDCVAVP